METERFDSQELYRLDETIRNTMDAIRRSPQLGGMGGGVTSSPFFGGWQGPGHTAQQQQQQQQFGGGLRADRREHLRARV